MSICPFFGPPSCLYKPGLPPPCSGRVSVWDQCLHILHPSLRRLEMRFCGWNQWQWLPFRSANSGSVCACECARLSSVDWSRVYIWLNVCLFHHLLSINLDAQTHREASQGLFMLNECFHSWGDAHGSGHVRMFCTSKWTWIKQIWTRLWLCYELIWCEPGSLRGIYSIFL